MGKVKAALMQAGVDSSHLLRPDWRSYNSMRHKRCHNSVARAMEERLLHQVYKTILSPRALMVICCPQRLFSVKRNTLVLMQVS